MSSRLTSWTVIVCDFDSSIRPPRGPPFLLRRNSRSWIVKVCSGRVTIFTGGFLLRSIRDDEAWDPALGPVQNFFCGLEVDHRVVVLGPIDHRATPRVCRLE